MSPPKKEVDLSTYRGRCAKRLKMLRERCGYSVEEAAEMLIEAGVIKNSRSLYHWENAKGLPKIEQLPEIAKVYRLKSARSVLSEN